MGDNKQKHLGPVAAGATTYDTAPDLAAAQKKAFPALEVPEEDGFKTVHVYPGKPGMPRLKGME